MNFVTLKLAWFNRKVLKFFPSSLTLLLLAAYHRVIHLVVESRITMTNPRNHTGWQSRVVSRIKSNTSKQTLYHRVTFLEPFNCLVPFARVIPSWGVGRKGKEGRKESWFVFTQIFILLPIIKTKMKLENYILQLFLVYHNLSPRKTAVCLTSVIFTSVSL